MKNPDGSPNTAHTTNPVPLILVSKHYQGTLKEGKLGDIAPTLLQLMKLQKPDAMTGNSLVE
jgi:2,3-bisphosphoglycerate-independent phosphoglycerate mutase